MVTPPDTRPQVPEIADEHTMLEGFLDFHRATLRWKCAGLTDDQLRLRAIEPSSMSLLGLVRHMVGVELGWFVRAVGREDVTPTYYSDDNPDGDFDDVAKADVPTDFAAYDAAIARSKAAAAGVSLEDEFVHRRTGARFQLRWVYLHMIEEYARHNGHADLLRERIDGATGE
jgi:hypothetical protein